MPTPVPAAFTPERVQDQIEGRFLRYIRRVERILRSVYFWWALCLFCAGVHGWANRHSMNPDGLSYLDMASRSLRDGPQNLVNGYWSPLYPALIGLGLFVLRPSPA